MTSLGDLCALGAMVLRRDAPVQSLGFVEIALEGRLVFAASRPFLEQAMATPGIAAIVTLDNLADGLDGHCCGLAVAADPRRAFVDLHNHLATRTDFYGPRRASRISERAFVHPRAHVDETGVVVGEGCRIEAGAVLLSGTTLGADVRIMPGAVLGADGFQTMRFDGDERIDLVHAGGIEIGARTVVMANAVVARAVFRQSTRIGPDCRIGNTSFISHNCVIGAHTLIGHGAIVAGNCSIAGGVTLGPGAVCLDRLSIGEAAFVTAGAVVTKPVGARQRVSGNFAVPHERFLRSVKRSVDE